MEPTPELLETLRQEEIERARRMDPAKKFLASVELFDLACWATRAGIRHQHPDADEQEVLRILRERLAMRKRREREEEPQQS